MNKIKALLLQFVKPLVLAHIKDLDMLNGPLAKVIVDKTHAPQDQADALAKDLVDVIQTELEVLINKI